MQLIFIFFVNKILEDFIQCSTEMNVAICIRRPVMKHIKWLFGIFFQAIRHFFSNPEMFAVKRGIIQLFSYSDRISDPVSGGGKFTIYNKIFIIYSG